MTDRELARALRRPGALPPFLTAVGILVALVVLGFLGATLSALAAAVQIDDGPAFFGAIWASQLGWALAGPVPIALGAFLCFWQIAPIAANLRLAHVITRAVLAGLAGALLLFVFGLVIAFGYFLLWTVSLVDEGDPFGPGVDGVPVLPLLFQSLATFVQVLPVLVLGAVLLWGWLQRHPHHPAPRGTLDEV